METYRKMLEVEETRLGMSPTSSPQFASSARGVKRRRSEDEEEEFTLQVITDHKSQGKIKIEDLPKDGKSITLVNISDADFSLDGCTLYNYSDATTSYKFQSNTKIAPRSECTIWSCNAEKEHAPPSTLVMKKGGWAVGSQNKTVLVNKDGAEEATRTSREERRQTGSYRRGTLSQEERRQTGSYR